MPGVRVAQIALTFVRTGLAYVPIVPVCDPTVPASGLTGRAIGQIFPAQVFLATGRIAPARAPIVQERVPTVPPFGRIVPLPARSVQPIGRPDRKRVRSVPYRDPKRGHRDLHPARASSPLDRSHGRAGRNSARRYSGPPTVRMCSARRPIDPDRSRGHGLRRNGRARKEAVTCGNKQGLSYARSSKLPVRIPG